MRTLLPILALASTLLAPVRAQADETGDARGGKALQVVLTPDGRFARSNDPFYLQVQVHARQDTELDFGVLDGSEIELYRGKHRVGTIAAPEKEKRRPWRLRAGSLLTLRLPLDLEGILRRLELEVRPGTVHELAVQALGDARTRTPFTVVCNPAALTLADLDLAKSRVALVTNFGTMLVGLRPDKAPKTVENFVKLAKEGFYDGTRFHRVAPGFMIQGGCPNTKDGNPMNDGLGDPGYRIPDERSNLSHVRGALSMANIGQPNTGGCQFFVMHANRPDLDGSYSIFGKLVEGLDTLDRICNVPVLPQPMDRTERSRPSVDVTLVRAVLVPTLR